MEHGEHPLVSETGHHAMCVFVKPKFDAYLSVSALSRHVNMSISHNRVLFIASSYEVVFVVLLSTDLAVLIFYS